MEEQMEKERHPFRLLLKLLVFVAFLYFAARLVYLKKDEYYGLTESQARTKIEERLEPRIGADKASEVAEQVIPLLKDRGVVKSDPVSEAASDLADTIADAEDDVEDAVDAMGDAVSEAEEEEAEDVPEEVK